MTTIVLVQSGSVCDLPSEIGSCDNYVIRYYYDKNKGECEYFYYGGCDGNGNNFETVDDCRRQCVGTVPAEVTQAPPIPTQGIYLSKLR